jgi:hypothetical protein
MPLNLATMGDSPERKALSHDTVEFLKFPSGWFYYLAIGGILALQFTLAQFSRRSFAALNLALFGLMWTQLASRSKAKGGFRPTLGTPFWLGGLLIFINSGIMVWQRGLIEGFIVSGLLGFQDLFVVGSMVAVYYYSGRCPFLNSLGSAACMIVFFGGANLIADKFGFGFSEITDRTEVFESRFSIGAYRWQSPLYSAWQLSGLLRVALPMTVLFAVAPLAGVGDRLFWGSLSLFSVVLLVMLEYRASVMPLVVLLATLMFRSSNLGMWIMIGSIHYPLIAPLMLTRSFFQTLLMTSLPDFVPAILGQKLNEIITFSSRTEMWQQGLEGLLNGSHLLVGEGHFMLDCSDDISVSGQTASEMFRRISFHQGVIDHFFIYGSVGASIILLVAMVLFWMGARRARWEIQFSRLSLNDGYISVAFLAMVAIANSHDGFLVEGNHMYLLITLALNSLWVSHASRAHHQQLGSQ